MSTIVAVKKNGKACIAADTLTTFGEVKQSSEFDKTHDKIYLHRGTYFGIVGSAAHHIVIQSLLTKHGDDLDFSSQLDIFESFRKLHPILKEDYFLNPKDEEDDPYESSRIDTLLINPHGIFAVYALREVFEYSRFWAVGSGGDIALGAMYAIYNRLESAEEIAKVGVEAGATFNNATALPLTSYTIDLNN
jgi:ATP-dependent protease HslVU (ClpYQ) peptidase subunit